jgi:hypothetical protein
MVANTSDAATGTWTAAVCFFDPAVCTTSADSTTVPPGRNMQPLKLDAVKNIDITSSCHDRFIIISGASHA